MSKSLIRKPKIFETIILLGILSTGITYLIISGRGQTLPFVSLLKDYHWIHQGSTNNEPVIALISSQKELERTLNSDAIAQLSIHKINYNETVIIVACQGAGFWGSTVNVSKVTFQDQNSLLLIEATVEPPPDPVALTVGFPCEIIEVSRKDLNQHQLTIALEINNVYVKTIQTYIPLPPKKRGFYA